MKRRILSALTALFMLFVCCLGEPSKASAADITETDGFLCQRSGDGGSITLIKYTGTKKKVVVPDRIDGTPVTAVGEECFMDNQKITEVILPDSVAVIGDFVFRNCRSLKKVRLPRNITVLPESTFISCRQLKSIDLPKKLTVIGDGALAHSGLTKVTIPASVTVLETSAFSDCYNLKKITIPKNSRLKKIGFQCFALCKKLKTITLPASIKTLEPQAFEASCFEKISFAPNAKIKEIPDYCFCDCYNLKEVDIPKNVTTLGSNLFDDFFGDAVGVKKINIMGGRIKRIGENSLKYISSNAVICVPSKYKVKYTKLFTKQSWYQPTMQIR